MKRRIEQMARRMGKTQRMKLAKIVANYDLDQEGIHARTKQLEALVRERTEIDIDIDFRRGCQVIMTGRYRNNDYIKIFSIREEDFERLIERLLEMERFGEVRRIDSPPCFREAFRRQLRR
jgi:hypothetical protein